MSTSPAEPITRWSAATTGVIGGAAALAGGELVGGLVGSWKSPVVAVAEAIIDRVPRALKDFAIETFGSDDKTALVIGVLLVAAVAAVVLGLLGRRRPMVTCAGLVAFGLVGAWASQDAVGSPWHGVLPSLAASLVGIGVYLGLRRRAPSPVAGTAASETEVADPDLAGPPREMPTERPKPLQPSSRRQFLVTSGVVAIGAAAMATAGRALSERFSAASSRAALMLPRARRPLDVPPSTIAVTDADVSPFFTPNADFYRVDTALVVPQVRVEDWELRIHGLVDRELRLSFDDLVGRGLIEEDLTLTCVSNTVGGKLVGTARWLGVPLQQLLEEAGVRSDADQIVGRSTDGYTCGFPVAALDGRPALVAVGMNGEPLPIEHGFPARLLVAGLYGYVSACKWLTEIELTTFDAFDQYWVERGWDREAPIKTMTRIDTPRSLERVSPGIVPIAGVAWAQTRGISKVEVSIDDGEWIEATLADELNINTWRQWSLPWEATPGRHRLTVRAIDGRGDVQIEERSEPFPNGASGWMSLFVEVTPNP